MRTALPEIAALLPGRDDHYRYGRRPGDRASDLHFLPVTGAFIIAACGTGGRYTPPRPARPGDTVCPDCMDALHDEALTDHLLAQSMGLLTA